MLSATHLSMKITSKDANDNDVTEEFKFALDQSNFNEDSNGWRNMRQISDLLNAGGLTGVKVSDGSSVKLSELGGFASGANGNLTISLSDNRFSLVALHSRLEDGIGRLTNKIDEASNIQIFTREGRHIAGSTPTDSKIAYWQSQMNESGAFNAGAVYNGDYRNESGVSGYMDVQRSACSLRS